MSKLGKADDGDDNDCYQQDLYPTITQHIFGTSEFMIFMVDCIVPHLFVVRMSHITDGS